MAWKKPHQWMMNPETVTEIRREMNIRESCHTALVWPKKYFDIDTGLFILDKCEKVYSMSMNDLMADERGDFYRFNTGYYERQVLKDKYPSLKYEPEF